MSTTHVSTLMVETSRTKCGACGQGADPNAEEHLTAVGYGADYPAAGCGARFTAISTDTDIPRDAVRDAVRALLHNMRPDLPIVDAFDGQGLAVPGN